MSEIESENSNSESEELCQIVTESKMESKNGCKHYERDCKIQSPCCKKFYSCRICHDDAEDHTLIRQNIEIVQCLHCKKEQDISNQCVNTDCKTIFGKYYCDLCHFFDNVDKDQFHCDGCGLCRIGGKENFVHCEICQMCLPFSIKDTHKCIAEISQRNCAVCLEYLHTSRVGAHIPSCGHLIHRKCFNNLLKNGIYACPTCGVCIIEMDKAWKMLDREISETPMPDEYANCSVYVNCKDCQKETLTAFHILGQKCADCGSFNTARGRGSILTQEQVDKIRNCEQDEVDEMGNDEQDEVNEMGNDEQDEVNEMGNDEQDEVPS